MVQFCITSLSIDNTNFCPNQPHLEGQICWKGVNWELFTWSQIDECLPQWPNEKKGRPGTLQALHEQRYSGEWNTWWQTVNFHVSFDHSPDAALPVSSTSLHDQALGEWSWAEDSLCLSSQRMNHAPAGNSKPKIWAQHSDGSYFVRHHWQRTCRKMSHLQWQMNSCFGANSFPWIALIIPHHSLPTLYVQLLLSQTYQNDWILYYITKWQDEIMIRVPSTCRFPQGLEGIIILFFMINGSFIYICFEATTDFLPITNRN